MNEIDAKNNGIRRVSLASLQAIVQEMVELPSDQIMWNHVSNIALAASAIQDELNGTETKVY